jgi:hypothetical protein
MVAEWFSSSSNDKIARGLVQIFWCHTKGDHQLKVFVCTFCADSSLRLLQSDIRSIKEWRPSRRRHLVVLVGIILTHGLSGSPCTYRSGSPISSIEGSTVQNLEVLWFYLLRRGRAAPSSLGGTPPDNNS